MKKRITFVLALVCTLVFAGCNNAKQEQVSTYSFHGDHEYFTISNGSIILGETEEVFDGGDLEVTQSGLFEEIASYSTTFYIFTNGERKNISSHTIIDQTGSSANLNGDIGKMSGEGCVISNMVKNMDELKENFWFELKTTDFNGEENVYQIQLTLTE